MEKTSAITCEWTGRSLMDIYVYGASSMEEAEKAAFDFLNNELGEEVVGITLDKGHFSKWDYEEPQPEDWRDCYFFRTIDACPVDQREWWETA